MTSDRTCPFCQPDPDQVIFDAEQIFALWDAFPVSQGHVLVVTKRHLADWFAATAAEQVAILSAIEKVRDHILRMHSPAGFNIGINVGEAAGQTIPHLHLHVIPRYEGDVPDPRGGVRYVIPNKANYLKESVPEAWPIAEQLTKGGLLIRGGLDDPFLRHLQQDLEQADAIDIAVAFVLNSGVTALEDYFRDLLGRGGRIRLLTGDYQDVTDPTALLRLLDMDGDLTLRIFECGRTGESFHPKAYLLSSHKDSATAYVGSSNLSHTAFRSGVEWNYRITEPADPQGFRTIRTAFEELFEHPSTRAINHEWVESYRKRRKIVPLVPREILQERELDVPIPHGIQEEALTALKMTREDGNSAGLVVLATGLGKTWLSAFDSNRPEYRKILFVAHREEILDQAMKTFRKIRPSANLGRFTGSEKNFSAEILFASVQTLSRAPHLRKFSREAFDYIVVDEFHHASARTYRKLIDYFSPKFLLGLTATPERMDGGDLLALCQENLVYRCDLAEGIRQELLSPFHYYGVPDEVDYSNIPWRSTRFDEEELTSALATQKRAENALEQFQKRAGSRTLGFCCSIRHADFMAGFFKQRGIKAVAVHSQESSAPRVSSLEGLRDGELQIVFAVDIFNEGVDIPSIDTVMMLRPTESRILWLQQFGRGLRVAQGKERLTVIDYIGNHRTFLIKPQTLFDLGSGDHEVAAMLQQAAAGLLELPPGCDVTYELKTINILKGLLRTPKGVEAIKFYYEDFEQRQGQRPTAVEAHHDGYAPGSVRKTYGSWLGFVQSMGGLSDEQTRTLQRHDKFLENLEVTSMTKSFKMVLLLAMLNEDALPGEISIESLAQAFAHVARRSKALTGDVGGAIEDPRTLRSSLEKNPIAAWTGGKGTGGATYFEYGNGVFRSTLEVADKDRAALQELAREICDWRLAQYLDRSIQDSTEGFETSATVVDGRLAVDLPDRAEVSGIPYGMASVNTGGVAYQGRFSQRILDQLIKIDGSLNELPNILRGWFGPDAGRPGTRHRVHLEPREGGWELCRAGEALQSAGAEVGKAYARSEIAGLFGIEYKSNLWRQGFLKQGDHLFLLVTLDKANMAEEHRYEDKFLSREFFQWQSQNRQARDKPSGRILKEHKDRGLKVHLFVRKSRKVANRTSPFHYCGELEFVEWEGDNPITVRWQLLTALSETLEDRWRALPG